VVVPCYRDQRSRYFSLVVVVDEANHIASLESKLTDLPDGEQELADAVNALDHLSVKEPKDVSSHRMQIPFVGFQPVCMSEHMGALGMP
jgi:hypothetical protein